MKPDQNFSIPSPCHEDWSKMEPVHGGKHCLVCAKNVVDFTGMKPDEIRDYLIAQNGKRVCGRIGTTEIKKPHHFIQLREKWIRLRFIPIRYAAVFMISMLIILAGCEEDEKVDWDNWKISKKASAQEVEPRMTLGIILVDPGISEPSKYELYQDSINRLPASEVVIIGDGEY